MREKIKVSKLRNEIAAYLLENMKLPKGVKAHHTIIVSPKEDIAEIKLDTFMIQQLTNTPMIVKASIKTTIEKNSVKTDFIIGELDTYIEQSLKCLNDMLTSEKEQADEA